MDVKREKKEKERKRTRVAPRFSLRGPKGFGSSVEQVNEEDGDVRGRSEICLSKIG